VSADLDALDRGVVEAGQLAARALARVEALEARLGQIEQSPAGIAYRLGWEAGLRRGRGDEFRNSGTANNVTARPRHLSAVPPIGGAR
jgi:hypothetical protein